MQAMLNLTQKWLDDTSKAFEDCSVELQYNQDRLQDMAAPCLAHKRLHHVLEKAEQGCQAGPITPQAIVRWTRRPGLPALHPSDLTFVHAVWHDKAFNVCKRGELCDATEEEFEQLQCRNEKDALRLGQGTLPGDSEGDYTDKEEENEDEDLNEHGFVRVHVVNINDRFLRQYKEAARRWLRQPMSEDSAQVNLCTLTMRL